MRNSCIAVQILLVISCVAAYQYQHASRLSFYIYRGVPLHKISVGQRAAVNNSKKFVRTTITPAVEDMVREALQKAKYEAGNIKLYSVLSGKKDEGGRMVDSYRVSYSNPSTNQHCFFSFLAPTNGWLPKGLVCDSSCPGDVCKVDSRLIRSSSSDKSYNKDWEERKYHENKEEHKRDYIESFQNFDDHQGNPGYNGGNPGYNYDWGKSWLLRQ